MRARLPFPLLLLLALPTATLASLPEPVRYEVEVGGISCDLCAYGLKKKLASLAGVARVGVSVETGTVTVVGAGDLSPSPERVFAAVEAAGHELRGARLVAPRRIEAGRLVVGAWSVAIDDAMLAAGAAAGTIEGTLARSGDSFRLSPLPGSAPSGAPARP